ncbi:MAG: ABC transporter ATP-binding protein [Petrimonas sp.]|nr:ABC transporter ATP-binding protein [Petrimonas sp.]
MLSIRNLHAYYGVIEALKDVNIDVNDGKICSIIGSNGAGKTTLLKSISGMIQRTGSITWDNKELIHDNPKCIANAGVVHVPEGRHVFPNLTVKSNLEVGTVSWHGFFGNKPFQEDLQKVYEMFPRLKEREKQKAWCMSGGEQQMLAIGRALMARPKLLMLDEPSMGLAPLIIENLFERILEINRKQGITILLVEQNARMALEISDYAYVLEQGKILFHGAAKEIEADPRVVGAYLGHSHE